ncbi:RNA 3'-terminal phosphate cyclase/enolpyruvate transferase [Aspergillus fruticulosus]
MNEAQPSDPVRLDGREIEGGGQLVHIAVALSALTGRAVRIDHIRGNRSGKRGLKASHLAAIKALGELSGSRLVEAQVGSSSVGFYPPPPTSKGDLVKPIPKSISACRLRGPSSWCSRLSIHTFCILAPRTKSV